MSNFILPPIPLSPHPYSDFDIATYLEAQRGGFSTSPPPPEASSSSRQSRNDSGAFQVHTSSSSQQPTPQPKTAKGKGKEPHRQEEPSSSTSAPSSTPAPGGLLSSKTVPSRSKLEREQRERESGQPDPASSSRSSSPEFFWEDEPGTWIMSGRPIPPHSTIYTGPAPSWLRASTASEQPASPAVASTAPERRTPDRTFTAPAVSWSTFRALSPFSFEENHEDDNSSSSRDGDFTHHLLPSYPPLSPTPTSAAVSTAQPIHLRSVSGSTEVSEISLARHIDQLPGLTRCPPRFPYYLRPFTSPSPSCDVNPLTYSQQRFDLTRPSPLFQQSDSPHNSSSTSLGSRAHTPSGSRFVEHVTANGEGMYNSPMRFVGSRSEVALGVGVGGGNGDGHVPGAWAGVPIRELQEKREKSRRKGWRRVFCFR